MAKKRTRKPRLRNGPVPYDVRLRIVQAVNAMHFLEVVTEGFLHITTVYDKDPAKGAYPAVHSRHFGLFGQPLVTQYQGFCEATG